MITYYVFSAGIGLVYYLIFIDHITSQLPLQKSKIKPVSLPKKKIIRYFSYFKDDQNSGVDRQRSLMF